MTRLLIVFFVVVTLILSLSSLFQARNVAATSVNQTNFAHDFLKEFNDSLYNYESNLMAPVFFLYV